MRPLRTVPGVRNLTTIVATASSARVLNLHALYVDQPRDPDYRGAPMFSHPLLNRSIIVKHNVAPGEEDRLAPRRFNATKVIFPLDPSDLNLGGQYLFVDQHDFVGVLARNLEYGERPFDRDVTVLRVLDRLPTLDPFLVREALAKEEIEVDRSYFRFTQPDKARMLGFVEGEMGSLIKLCFGELRAEDRRTKRLSRLLLADHDAPDLLPLQTTLHMDDLEFAEAMFSWKALLYYRWKVQTLTPALKTTLRSISRLGQKRLPSDTLEFLLHAKTSLEHTIASAWRRIGEALQLYDRAYNALIEKQDPESFRRFLTQGSGLFLDLGEQIGRIEQLIGFWGHRLAQHEATPPEEVLETLRDLMQGMSIWPGCGPEPVTADPDADFEDDYALAGF
ncbi:MAG TPA: hypothetical protein VKT30_15100 [Caulobacteraceae bacterium]|nr:hypothetical protein [Caulobacteraceae bacterium]